MRVPAEGIERIAIENRAHVAIIGVHLDLGRIGGEINFLAVRVTKCCRYQRNKSTVPPLATSRYFYSLWFF
jgi:hypothetical protein